MKEQLISLETAKLAKEKGFDWKTLYRYQGDKNDYDIVGGSLYNHNDKEEQEQWCINLYSSPSQSLLQKWLRERHNFNLEIEYIQKDLWRCDVIRFDPNMIEFDFSYLFRGRGSSYEEALEVGLFEALKLI